MAFKMKYEIKYEYLTNSINRSKIKADKRLFQVAHDTGNINSTARNNVNYLNRKFKIVNGERFEAYNDKDGKPVPFRVASAHSFIDDKEIIVCIPLDEKAWHVLYNVTTDNSLFGDDANDVALGHELCFFTDLERSREAYKRFVWFNAYTLYLEGLNPIKHLVSHKQLDPKRKVDPDHAFSRIGKTFANFIQDVLKEIEDCTKIEEPKIPVEVDLFMKLSDWQWKRIEAIVQEQLDKKIISDLNWISKNTKEDYNNGRIHLSVIRNSRSKR